MTCPTFTTRRTVQAHEVDRFDTVHFSQYCCYLEEAEYEFLRSRGLSVVLTDEKGTIGFPRVRTEVQVEQPARLDDELSIALQLGDADGKQLIYDFRIRRDGDLLVAARFVVACCRFPVGKLPFAILIPEFVLERLGAIPLAGESGR